MKILDIFRRRTDIITNPYGGAYNNVFENRYKFANVIFSNITNLLTDLCNDVDLVNKNKATTKLYAQFKAFIQTWGKFTLNNLFKSGYVVIGYNEGRGFRVLTKKEYTANSNGCDVVITAHNYTPENVYVMKSSTYMNEGMSDYQFLHPWLEFLDNVMNASNTVSSRLGSLVVMSPAAAPSSATAGFFTKEQKEGIEKEMAKEYGALRNQKQIMVLSRGANFQTINLAGLDQKTMEKARMAILTICDCMKVPANQVAIIDASSSKSFANGTEMREGDFNKYQSFERLFNQTFMQMAFDLGLQLDYTIYNKPQRPTNETN